MQANQSRCPVFFPMGCHDNWICMMSVTREFLQFSPNLGQHLPNSAYAVGRVWCLSDWAMNERTTCLANMALLSWISFVPKSWRCWYLMMVHSRRLRRHHHYHLCPSWTVVATAVMSRVYCPNDCFHKCICRRWLASNYFRMVISTYSDCMANWDPRNLQTFCTVCMMKHSTGMALSDQNCRLPWVMCPMGVQKVCAAVGWLPVWIRSCLSSNWRLVPNQWKTMFALVRQCPDHVAALFPLLRQLVRQPTTTIDSTNASYWCMAFLIVALIEYNAELRIHPNHVTHCRLQNRKERREKIHLMRFFWSFIFHWSHGKNTRFWYWKQILYEAKVSLPDGRWCRQYFVKSFFT